MHEHISDAGGADDCAPVCFEVERASPVLASQLVRERLATALQSTASPSLVRVVRDSSVAGGFCVDLSDDGDAARGAQNQPLPQPAKDAKPADASEASDRKRSRSRSESSCGSSSPGRRRWRCSKSPDRSDAEAGHGVAKGVATLQSKSTVEGNAGGAHAQEAGAGDDTKPSCVALRADGVSLQRLAVVRDMLVRPGALKPLLRVLVVHVDGEQPVHYLVCEEAQLSDLTCVLVKEGHAVRPAVDALSAEVVEAMFPDHNAVGCGLSFSRSFAGVWGPMKGTDGGESQDQASSLKNNQELKDNYGEGTSSSSTSQAIAMVGSPSTLDGNRPRQSRLRIVSRGGLFAEVRFGQQPRTVAGVFKRTSGEAGAVREATKIAFIDSEPIDPAASTCSTSVAGDVMVDMASDGAILCEWRRIPDGIGNGTGSAEDAASEKAAAEEDDVNDKKRRSVALQLVHHGSRNPGTSAADQSKQCGEDPRVAGLWVFSGEKSLLVRGLVRRDCSIGGAACASSQGLRRCVGFGSTVDTHLRKHYGAVIGEAEGPGVVRGVQGLWAAAEEEGCLLLGARAGDERGGRVVTADYARSCISSGGIVRMRWRREGPQEMWRIREFFSGTEVVGVPTPISLSAGDSFAPTSSSVGKSCGKHGKSFPRPTAPLRAPPMLCNRPGLGQRGPRPQWPLQQPILRGPSPAVTPRAQCQFPGAAFPRGVRPLGQFVNFARGKGFPMAGKGSGWPRHTPEHRRSDSRETTSAIVRSGGGGPCASSDRGRHGMSSSPHPWRASSEYGRAGRRHRSRSSPARSRSRNRGRHRTPSTSSRSDSRSCHRRGARKAHRR